MTRNIAYCTIASANYLPQVWVLADSLKRYNPEASLHVLLCEHPEICRDLSEKTGQSFITPADICADWLGMAFYYDITEYNTALKPSLLLHLLNQGYSSVIYLDPDIEVFDSLKDLEDLANEHDLILTPHICEPMPNDGKRPAIDDIIRAGQFNLGFIGVSGSEDARKGMDWWQEVCAEHCLFDSEHRFFVDQFWADILPSFVQHFYCLRDPAYNMAYWNVFQRKLMLEGRRWLTDSGQLKFFHFSGLAKTNLTQVSRHQDRVVAPVGSPLYELLVGYLGKLEDNPYAEYKNHLYSFGQYATGEKISATERRKFLWLPRAEREELGVPFENPKAIRNITVINLAELNPRSLSAYVYRHSRYNYLKILVREYIAMVRNKGFVLANLTSLRFIGRIVRRLFDKSGS